MDLIKLGDKLMDLIKLGYKLMDLIKLRHKWINSINSNFLSQAEFDQIH